MCSPSLAGALTALLLASTPAASPPAPASSASDVSAKSRPRVTEQLPLPPDFTIPNGIAHAVDGTLYVGSVADGRVLRRAPGGAWTELFPGSEQVFSATSLRLDAPRNLLWGTSPDAMGLLRPKGTMGGRRHARIFALDARTGALRKLVHLPEGALGNDLTVAPDGGLYVTDSARASVLYLRPGGEHLETWVTDPRFKAQGTGMSAVGPAGIALAADGRTLAVNTYGPGRLFLIHPGASSDAPPRVTEVELPRRLENPDGMRFAPDGRLLLVEGSIQSGDGRLIRVEVLGKTQGPRTLEVLASELESPVNLTVSDEGTVWVTEARLRDRLLKGTSVPLPETFWVASVPLSR
ncbi:gluconolaconase [Myxococcus sp. CA056]|uniref:SMP-30/gluconolactonase/LRE family protein n=1 Tax=unclassified Myxococcus TaxID=2648731 RepID=UPI00157B7138|nr:MULTISPECIES: gluconolaconase [unclassified Myxococcus]NTX13286.1 gluconolaconase [Myxococcus sp. CA056]NTX36262.1 gluconolaconase [Myxococcus sp. CA033]NTX53052.1 gluconolaconase [Myxococcus sp. CA039A]